MDISSTSNSSFSRSVTPSNSSRDRQAKDESQMAIAEVKTQERAQQQKAVQERLQQSSEENERRLDGRLISFGYQQNDDNNSQQQQVSYNRSRVNDAYSPPAQNERTSSQEHHEQRSRERNADAIDIVV